MAQATTRLGDICTGHGCYKPRPSTSASSDVFVNSIAVHRQGDSWDTHCCDSSCHDGVLVSGSSTVYVNGQQCGRIGDPISCGSAVAEGSSNVFVGG